MFEKSARTWQRGTTTCGLALIAATPASASPPLNYLTSSGPKADTILGLTWGVLVISLTVTVVIALLVAGAVWHRSGTPASQTGQRIPIASTNGGTSWIWIGVGLSTVVLFFTVIWTMKVLADVSSPATVPSLTIEVTGRQWWWQVRYLSADPSREFSTANEIHIPTGQPVKFRLIGGDVIHSFWVPALSGKTDMIPGQTNELWLEARSPGTYRGQCTEYCGVEHAEMGLVVVAQSPADFAGWWRHQLQSPATPTANASAAGMTAFNTHCGSCHAVRGTDAAGVLGPDLSHLMTRKTLAAGVLPNDPADLTRWITDPQAIKPGAMMQPPQLSRAELANVRAYLETLN